MDLLNIEFVVENGCLWTRISIFLNRFSPCVDLNNVDEELVNAYYVSPCLIIITYFLSTIVQFLAKFKKQKQVFFFFFSF